MDLSGIGKALLVMGLIIAAAGLLLTLGDKIPWLGRLPGDITYRGKNVTFYFPLATSILISVVLTLVLWFLNRK